MRDDSENVAQLELLRAQRVQLASRLKTPWWYTGATAFGWAVAFAMPLGSHYLTGAGIGGSLLAIVALLLAQRALARISGVDVGMRTWQYPSSRPWTIAIAVVILTGSGAEAILLDRGLVGTAIVVGLVAALAGTGCWHGHLRGIRRDLSTGWAAM